LPKQLIDLATWIQQFYASTVGVVTQLILPNLAKLPEIDQDDDRKLVIKELPTLRTEQVNAIEMMKTPIRIFCTVERGQVKPGYT